MHKTLVIIVYSTSDDIELFASLISVIIISIKKYGSKIYLIIHMMWVVNWYYKAGEILILKQSYRYLSKYRPTLAELPTRYRND